MKNNIAILLTSITCLLCLSASAWMPAPPAGYHAASLFDIDPNDPCTNCPPLPVPTSGMFVTRYSTNDTPCAFFVTGGVDYTSTNINFSQVCELVFDLPWQTPLLDGQYVFALFPSNYVSRATNTPFGTAWAWNTFTNVSGGVTNVFVLMNGTTLYLPAHQGVYTAYFNDTNSTDPYPYDWTNIYCAPVPTVEGQFAITNYTSASMWYPNQFAPVPPFRFDVMYLYNYNQNFTNGSVWTTIHIDENGTPDTTWQVMLNTNWDTTPPPSVYTSLSNSVPGGLPPLTLTNGQGSQTITTSNLPLDKAWFRTQSIP
jgi:hypothetical protein